MVFLSTRFRASGATLPARLSHCEKCLDYLDGKPVAALVYRYRQYVTDVFVWPLSENREVSVQTWALRGYNITRFDSRGMSFWAVSDLNPEDLQKLANLLRMQRSIGKESLSFVTRQAFSKGL